MISWFQAFAFTCNLYRYIEVAFIADDKLKREGCRDNVRIVVTSPVEWPLPDGARWGCVYSCV